MNKYTIALLVMVAATSALLSSRSQGSEARAHASRSAVTVK